MRRIAIVPGNILVSEASAAWLRNGLPVILENDLASAAHLSAVFVDSESQAYQAQASEILRTTLEHRDSRYRISVVLTDLSSQAATDTFVLTQPDSAGLIEAGNAVAKHLDTRASRFSTHVPDALQAYVGALMSPDLSARTADLGRAIQLDPTFGLAYFAAIDAVSTRNPEMAQNLLHEADAQKGRFTALDQARLAAISSRLSHAPLPVQAKTTEALLSATPNSLEALISVASLRFLQGDAASGKALLQKALMLSPGNAAVRSYLALGLVETRQLRQAEAIYQSLQADPAFLPQLAACILLEGDTRRADGVFAKFVALRKAAGDVGVPLIQANWFAVSGRVENALALLKSSRLSSLDLQSIALSQSAIWELMGNDVSGAQTDAAASLRLPASPPVQRLASAAHAISFGARSLQSLRDYVNAIALRQDQKAVVLAYGMFLNRHFAEAAGCWKDILDRSGGADLPSRAMLAASLDRAGKVAAPGALPVQPFIPSLNANDQFAAISFLEMRRLLSR